MTATLMIVAVLAALWAGALALADEAPNVFRVPGEPPPPPGEGLPAPRAFHVVHLALLIVSAGAAAAALRWWERPLTAAMGAVTVGALFIYALGDGLPRALGTLLPHLARASVPLARASLAPFQVLLVPVASADRLAHRLLPSGRPPAGRLGTVQRDMLAGVFSLADTTVAEVMTPRMDIVAIESGATWSDVVEQLRRSEHARIPVCADSLDDIAGILHAKDLAAAVAGAKSPPERWQELVRPALFVPELKTLAAQLRDFQRGLAHMAIVVDEFGGTSGLITLEDILEEIVGEIHDEYDQDERPPVEQEGNERFWVDGRLTLDDLTQYIGTKVEHADVSTVAGLIYSLLGRVPRPGEELRVEGFRVVVEQVAGRRIRRVYFERVPEADAALPVVDREERA